MTTKELTSFYNQKSVGRQLIGWCQMWYQGLASSVGCIIVLVGGFYPHSHEIVAAPLGRNKRGRLTNESCPLLIFYSERKEKPKSGHMASWAAKKSGKLSILESCACV